jgi:hypothetical protein
MAIFSGLPTDVWFDTWCITALFGPILMPANEKFPPGWLASRNLRRIHVPALDGPRLEAVYSAIGEIELEGDFAQFGVYRGRTAQVIAALTSGRRKLHLFDSFEGLPEDWTESKKAGHFRLEPDDIPRFDPKVTVVHKGWFKDTVPVFARERKEPLAFIHMDADLYSSTVDVLHNGNDIIAKDTIILFDEYASRKMDDEHRAFVDWVDKFDRGFDYLWRSDGLQVCVRITK